jgi:hypothetical protein
MKLLAAGVGTLIAIAIAPSAARADNTCSPAAPQTWGATPVAAPIVTPEDTSPVSRARDLLNRAKMLDERAAADERASTELAARLPTLRATAKAARDKADRASGDDRETLASRAEDLEADVAVTEAEVSTKKRSGLDNRRIAREFRARAVKIVKEIPADGSEPLDACDPPFRFTADGRKIYRIECLK